MNIVLYTLPHCSKCHMLKMYLNSLNIKYEERNAQDFVPYLTSHGFSTTPILELNGQLFDFVSISYVLQLLEEKGLY